MSVIYGTREVATIGARKHVTITYPAPNETLLGVPVGLPDADPGTPQITWTVGAGDLPTLTNLPLDHVILVPMLYVAGHNLDSGVHAFHFLATVNGNYLDNATYFTDAAAKWMISIFPDVGNVGNGIVAGDVIEITVWSDDLFLDYEYVAFALGVTRPRVEKDGTVLLHASFQTIVAIPLFTTPGVVGVTGRFASATSTGLNPGSISFGHDVSVMVVDGDAPCYRIGFCDTDIGEQFLNDSAQYFYANNSTPTDITWYPTSIRVV